jgi:hypothetical protein
MRRRTGAMVTALGLGVVLAVPALPASAKSVTIPNLNALTNSINHAKMLTYYAQYTQVSGGHESTVTIAHSPSRSNFSTSSSSVIINEKATYYCSLHSDSTSISGDSGTTSLSGASGTTSLSGASGSKSSKQHCLTEKGANPTLGIGDVLSPTAVLAALAEAKEGLVTKRLGIEVSSSSASFAGQPSTCVTVSVHGKGDRYCVTKQGILSYSGSSSSDYFRLTKYSSKSPASLFTLPAGATTTTRRGAGSLR